eukprot:UN05410
MAMKQRCEATSGVRKQNGRCRKWLNYEVGSYSYIFHKDLNNCIKYSELSSLTTHPGDIASYCCSFLALIIHHGLKRETNDNIDITKFLENCVKDYLKLIKDKKGKGVDDVKKMLAGKNTNSKEDNWNWKQEALDLREVCYARGQEYNGYPCVPDYFGAFSLDGLAIAFNR